MNDYEKGDVPRIAITFANAAGDPVDPTTVALTYRKPDGTQTTVTLAGAQVVREALGSFYYDLAVDQAGRWDLRWVSTGPGAACEQAAIWVNSNPMTGTDP